MAKKVWRPGTMIYPLPAILVGCGNAPENYNLITVAWVGTICSDPAMCYVSVRKERHSYALLKENMEFTLNLTNRDMARAADWVDWTGHWTPLGASLSYWRQALFPSSWQQENPSSMLLGMPMRTVRRDGR